MSPRRLSDDEHALWSGVTRSVAPLRRRAHRNEAGAGPSVAAAVRAPAPKSPPGPPAARPAIPPPPSPPPIAALGRRFKQEVARGKRPIDARLDLHGMTQAQAHRALLSFLRGAQARGSRVVLVITGKGAPGDDHLDHHLDHQPGERGVLRRQVPRWLRTPEFRVHAAGFEAAAIGHGGEGALYVSLRRLRS